MANNDITTYLVFYPKSRSSLALSLAKRCEKTLILKEIDQSIFPDKEPNFTLPSLHDCFNRDVLYIADWSSPAMRWHDMLCLYPIAELNPRTLTIILPFLGSGTMEREAFDGNIATANVEAKMLSALPGRSLKRVIPVDLHTLQNQFYYMDTCVSMASYMPHLELAPSQYVICFPDNGAKSRFAKYFADYDIALCGKQRIGEEGRKITLEEGNVNGRDVVIVDDLVRTGSTLFACAEVLKKHGAESISVFVTHPVFPNQSWRKFLESDLIEHFVTTDSVYFVAEEIRDSDTSGKFDIRDLGECLWKLL
jgi:phosphoribosylpyrophosphate synthetase